jgi:hypothetical protein
LPKARPVEPQVDLDGLGSVRVEPYPPLPKARPVEPQVNLDGLGSVRVEPYPPLPKARPVEPQVATSSATDPADATVKPPGAYESDKSLRPLSSNDGAQRLDQPKRIAAARLRAHTPRVALGNSPPGYAGSVLILPSW